MRLMVEMLIIGGLIYLGWDKPFIQWATELRAKVPTKQTAAAAQETEAAPATPVPGRWLWNPDPGVLDRPAHSAVGSAPSQVTPPTPASAIGSQPGAWRSDPNHRSVLDRPAYDQTGPAPQATPPRHQDASGRSYWIDANGVRHYDQ
jgi:hypothetical protein